MVNLELEDFVPNNRSIQEELSPRDLMFLRNLNRNGLTLIELKVSPLSPAVGKKVSELVLPEGSMVINVIKKKRRHFPSEDIILHVGDIIYFIVKQEAEELLRQSLRPSPV